MMFTCCSLVFGYYTNSPGLFSQIACSVLNHVSCFPFEALAFSSRIINYACRVVIGGDIEDTFRNEIIPSFSSKDAVRLWTNFTTEALRLSNREVNHATDHSLPLKQQWLKMLLLWLDKNKGSGKQKSNEGIERE